VLGVQDQRVHVLRVVGVDADPDARGEEHLATVDVEVLTERVPDPRRGPLCRHRRTLEVAVLVAVEVAQQDEEVVPTAAREGVDVAQRDADPLRDLLEEVVAPGGAERFVRELEAVDVDHEDGDRTVLPFCMADRHLAFAQEHREVRQRGQAVAVFELLEPRAHGLQVGDVLDHAL